MEAWREELYHHGIEGQKWGVRNGPPYPLDFSQLSGRERRMAKKVEKTMQKATKKYVKKEYHTRYADSKVGSEEKAKRMMELTNEFVNSQQYKNLMERRYTDVIMEQNIDDAKRPARIVNGIIGGLSAAYLVYLGNRFYNNYLS